MGEIMMALKMSNNDVIHNQKIAPKSESDDDKIVQRLGGEANLDYIIMSYCERILDDEMLTDIFGHFETKSLLVVIKELLLTAFAGPNSKYQNLHPRASLRHESLIEIGMNEFHFDILQSHFLDALRENWVEDNLIQSCGSNFARLRCIFEEE